MRSHAQIIEDAGGVTPIRKGLAEELASVGKDLPDETVRSWPGRADGAGSIPAEYWPLFAKLGWATVEELALAAERRKFPSLPPSLRLEAST